MGNNTVVVDAPQIRVRCQVRFGTAVPENLKLDQISTYSTPCKIGVRPVSMVSSLWWEGFVEEILLRLKWKSNRVVTMRLRSATRHQLIVPLHRRSRFGRRAFSVAGPMVWNMAWSSPWSIAQHRIFSISTERRNSFSQCTGTRSAVEALCVMRYASRQSSSSSMVGGNGREFELGSEFKSGQC